MSIDLVKVQHLLSSRQSVPDLVLALPGVVRGGPGAQLTVEWRDSGMRVVYSHEECQFMLAHLMVIGDA